MSDSVTYLSNYYPIAVHLLLAGEPAAGALGGIISSSERQTIS